MSILEREEESMGTNLLMSTSELAGLIDESDVRIVDLRWSLDDEDRGQRDYERSHIPGAVYLHWLRDLSDPSDSVAGQIATQAQFAEAMEQVGIGDGTMVVAYDDGEILMAPRLLWSLHYYGHENVRVLDGGWRRWVAETRPTEQEAASYGRAEIVLSVRAELRSTKADVLRNLSGDTPILDCRMDETWTQSNAHIPGARRFPAPRLVDDQGTYIAVDEIRRRADALELDRSRPVLLYCGGGVSASAAYLALRSAGFTQLSVYDGSWSEWSADPDTPKQAHAGLEE